MDFKQKIGQLRHLLEDALVPLIDSDYVFLDIPFYQNIGDLLIWEGTEYLLAQVGHKCLYKASVSVFDKAKVPDGAIIVMQGGGNFGDIWMEHQQFRLSVIRNFPGHKIIILPQTVYYGNEEVLEQEAAIMRAHSRLTVCARDEASFALLKEKNMAPDVLLLPDMAFCIPEHSLVEFRNRKKSVKCLLLKRGDKELAAGYDYHLEDFKHFSVHDWPSYEHLDDPVLQEFWRLKDAGDNVAWARYAEKVFKPYWIKEACSFVSAHSKVYSSRLHVAILCILLHKPVLMLDNSYGKNSRFYDTWLSDLDKVYLWRKGETEPKERSLVTKVRTFFKKLFL